MVRRASTRSALKRHERAKANQSSSLFSLPSWEWQELLNTLRLGLFRALRVNWRLLQLPADS
jgi:hypothetical protein